MAEPDVVAYFDGACQPINPRGIATFGVVVFRGPTRVYERGDLAAAPFVEDATNNVAEYGGFVHALEWLAAAPWKAVPIIVRGDSTLVISQVLGRYRVHAPRLKGLHERATKALAELPHAQFERIPRAQNQEADRVAHEVYVRLLDEDPALRREALPHMAPVSVLRQLDELGIAYPRYLSRFDARRLLEKVAHDAGL